MDVDSSYIRQLQDLNHILPACNQVLESIVDSHDLDPRLYSFDGHGADGAVYAGGGSASDQDSKTLAVVGRGIFSLCYYS